MGSCTPTSTLLCTHVIQLVRTILGRQVDVGAGEKEVALLHRLAARVVSGTAHVAREREKNRLRDGGDEHGSRVSQKCVHQHCTRCQGLGKKMGYIELTLGVTPPGSQVPTLH